MQNHVTYAAPHSFAFCAHRATLICAAAALPRLVEQVPAPALQLNMHMHKWRDLSKAQVNDCCETHLSISQCYNAATRGNLDEVCLSTGKCISQTPSHLYLT